MRKFFRKPTGRYEISHEASRQIAIVRTIAIFFMMSVHVNPGFGAVAEGGVLYSIAAIEVQLLGRASVAALSVISGFLLIHSMSKRTFTGHAISRFTALYVPGVFWNAVTIVFALGAVLILHHDSSISTMVLAQKIPDLLVSNVLYLNGVPATPALGFLRDLFVSSVLLAFLTHVCRVPAKWLLVPIFFLTLFDAAEPIIFRPTIFLFMATGAAIAQSGKSLTPPHTVAFAAACIALFYGATETGLVEDFGNSETQVSSELENIAKRTSLTIVLLYVAAELARTRVGRWLGGMGESMYLAFLTHSLIFSVLWVAWSSAIGPQTSGIYYLFFFLVPVVPTALAHWIQPFIDRLPIALQKVLRGKARTLSKV